MWQFNSDGRRINQICVVQKYTLKKLLYKPKILFFTRVGYYSNNQWSNNLNLKK